MLPISFILSTNLPVYLLKHGEEVWPVASRALVICRREKPISSSGTAMAGGGGDVDRRLLGSDRAAWNKQSWSLQPLTPGFFFFKDRWTAWLKALRAHRFLIGSAAGWFGSRGRWDSGGGPLHLTGRWAATTLEESELGGLVLAWWSGSWRTFACRGPNDRFEIIDSLTIIR